MTTSPGTSGSKMGCLFGYIITFLGAAIFNIAGGVPILPLQTLWVSFTTQSCQAIGLGYSRPAAGLMDRQPRPPARPILSRGLIAWLVCVGLLIAVGTLGVISWARPPAPCRRQDPALIPRPGAALAISDAPALLIHPCDY